MAHSLPVRSCTPQPDVPGNPFAVRVHPDAWMEAGKQPGVDGANGRCVNVSPSQHEAEREGHMLDSCQRTHPGMYSGATSGAMYASFVDPEPACSPSNSPHPTNVTSGSYHLQAYSQPAPGIARHTAAMLLETYNADLAARKNISGSNGSTSTGLSMFPVAELGTVPLRPDSATPSVYSHPMHASQHSGSGALGSIPPSNRISATRRARSMVVRGSTDVIVANACAVERSQTMPRGGAAVLQDGAEEPQADMAGSFPPEYAADTTTSVMGQLSGLLTNPGSVGLPPGVIAGAHMHRRETRLVNGSMHVPTSGSDGTVVHPNRSDHMSPPAQAPVHSVSRPVTDSAMLGAGGVSGAMHAGMPARPLTDSACAAGRHAQMSHGTARITNGGCMEQRGIIAPGQRSSSWAGSMPNGAGGGGPRMCYSSAGDANGVHSAQHTMDADAAARGASPSQPSMLAEPLETLRLTPDMMHSGSFPGHMGRVAGVQQQLQQLYQHQMQQQHLQESGANVAISAAAAALKRESQELCASYMHGSPTSNRPPAAGANTGLNQWAGHNTNVTMNGDREFLQGDTLAFSAAGRTHATSDASQPHSSLLLPMSVDCMSEGESDYDDDLDVDQDGYSPQPHALAQDQQVGTPPRGSVQGIRTPEKPNPALLRNWSGYGGRTSDSGLMTARELRANGGKSTDSACEPSGEPSGVMGGVVIKKEDSAATGDGTVHSAHKHRGSHGEADKPPRRKRATGLTAEERRERRRKSNRESARRSRVRKLEETHESETAIATLQNSVTAQAKMLSVATEHLETMKVCLSQQEQRVGNLCDGISQLLGTIRAEASVGHVTSPVAKQAAALQKTLIHETNMAAQTQAHANAQQ